MLSRFFYDYVMPLTEPFLFMQLRGVRIDFSERKRIRDEIELKRAEAIARVESTFPRKIMAKKTISNKALAELLYEDMKLPVQIKRSTGKMTTDETAMNTLAGYVTEEHKQVFEDILYIRDSGVLISTFLEAEIDPDGRLRASYNIAGTETGRLSSSESPWWTGTNMQNWQKYVRNIVVSDRNMIYVYADGEQAEARMVGRLAKDDVYNAIFDSGEDVHLLMAERIFGIPYDEGLARYKANPDEFEERDLAKRTVHANNYGMGVKKFSQIIRKNISIAKLLSERYHQEFPGIRDNFRAGVRQQLESSRLLWNPFGRRRQFFGRMDEELYRKGYAYVPQSTIADWLDIGCLRLWKIWKQKLEVPEHDPMCKYLDVREFCDGQTPLWVEPAIQIHDGLLTQVPAGQIRKALPFIQQVLTYPIHLDDGGPLTIPVDIKIGTRWGTLKKPTEDWINQCIRDSNR